MMDGIASPEAAMMHAGVVMRQMPPASASASRARPPRALPLLDPRAWTDPAPPRRWVVPDWVPRGAVTALYSDGGTGKSLIAQQLLTCAALGLPWLGLGVIAGRALGVFCEDERDELQRRQESINAALGVSPDELSGVRLLSRLGEDNCLMDFTQTDIGVLTPFFADLETTVQQVRPALLVLDTAADLFGGNENVRPQVRRFIGACLSRLARDHDCAVLLLAHPSQSGMTSGAGTGGSTAWSNTVRSRLYFTRPTDEDAGAATDRRVLTRMKANYAPADARLEVVWRAGAFVPASGSLRTDEATWQAISAMFDELEAAWTDGRAWSYRAETRSGGRYFPVWAKRHLGIPEARTKALLSDWLMNKCLSFEEFNKRASTRGLRVVRRPDQ